MSGPADETYKRLFKATPGKILVLLPGSFEIVTATDEYLAATAKREEDIVGKSVFEVFPDDPAEPAADGERNLRTSLARVESLKAPDTMGIQRYPLRSPDGRFEERFWSSMNTPVLDDRGEIEFILHRTEDITGIVRERGKVERADEMAGQDAAAVQDIVLRSQELRQALSKLQEYEARMRAAERMLNLGTWEYHPQTGDLNWSSQVFDIHDLPASQGAPDLNGYFALVHPGDQAQARAAYQQFLNRETPQIELDHRIRTDTGEVRYIKAVGERHRRGDDEIVVGYVQDVTSLVRTREKLTQAEQLLRLAGEKAKLGGWRVTVDSQIVVWTSETAAIHGMPPEYSPGSVEEAIGFYAPADQDVIQGVFKRCVEEGKSFDVVCRLHTADGRRPWVRSLGVAQYNDYGRVIAVQGAFQDITSLQEARERAAKADRARIDILESIGDAFYALDHEWNFTYLNRKACALLGRSAGELLGHNLWAEFPETLGKAIERQYRGAVAGQRTKRFQSYYAPRGKWLEISAYPIPEGLAVYLRDVTQQREYQQQLRMIEAALARQNDTVIITEAAGANVSADPRVVYVNDAYERLTGRPKDEALGQRPWFLQRTGADPKQLARIRAALYRHAPIRCELRDQKQSGAAYWLELEVTPLFDADGECTHYVAVQRDISRRKAQEAELRQARERFELISRAVNDVIWDWDLATGNVWWNDAVTAVFGYARQELDGGRQSWQQCLHPEDRAQVAQSVAEVIASESVLWRGEYRFIKKDGQVASVVDRGFVIRDEAGRAIRMVGSMLDVSERIDMESRLREAQKLEAVGHLTGGVAHDFNNLLTVILGNAEVMAEQADNAMLSQMAQMTVAAAQRGAELTSRLLAFARRQPLNPELTNVNGLIQAIQPLVERTLPADIELETVLDPQLGLTEIDASELDTALLNLAVNARDAIPEGGKLTIETANSMLDDHYAERHPEVEAGDYVMIGVTDTGSGMDTETLRRVFEPFFTTKAVGKGSGLGLSMVFGFTKQSGGHIKIYSEPGEGTCVKLYFPRSLDTQRLDRQPAAKPPAQGGSEHILIAEDDDLVLAHLEGQLRSLGYRVTSTISGPAALSALEKHPDIDLLLTDIIMPGGMNGRQLADQAAARYPALKILFTSGYTENAIVHQGRLDPGVELLGKPYTRQELATKVRSVLDRA
ncbi:PAS domain S-box protein [Salinisphaera sp.]|uniref:PAS domain S-box protein n=1 Tax=Salinisphaera sp. TaxID=1914330 RepID=UPI000C49D880|nr:PAS domain S-box protein [Salinisphaera sp.]MBS64309.1 hybrid sensor histidine kinase/response regulator [Salinisphaera sp.]